MECDGRSGFLPLFHFPDIHDIRSLRAAGKLLTVYFPVTAETDLCAHIIRKRVDAAYADSVQSARDFISPAAELSARMQHGQRNGKRVFSCFFMISDWDASSVIPDDN